MDVIFYNAATGDWNQMVSTGTSFATLGTGRWEPNLVLAATDLNGDGHEDLFTYNPTRGSWVQVMSR
jgi:hypothetical protein